MQFKREKKVESRKNMIFVSTAILSFVLISLVVAFFCGRTPEAPDPSEMTKLSAAKYLATKEFGALPDSEKHLYFEKIAPKPGERRGPPPEFEKMSKDERDHLHKNMRKLMYEHMKKRLQKFFSSSKEEQDKMLDEMISERKEREQNGPPPDGGDPGKHMQDMLENTDSTTRAQMCEVHELMRAREAGK